MVDLTLHKKAVDDIISSAKKYEVSANPRLDFADELRSNGFEFDGQILIDTLTRIKSPEDRGNKKSAWYWYNEIELDGNAGQCIGVGVYECYKQGFKQVWKSKGDNVMSQAERLRYQDQMQKYRALREQEEAIKHREASDLANTIYINSSVATDPQGYLVKKGVTASSTLKVKHDRYECGELVIPIEDENGKITTIQTILNEGDYFNKDGEPIGNKKLLFGGKKKGCFHRIKGSDNTKVYVCEGYATGRSINMATDSPVYCAIDSGNLYEVASIAKKQNKDSKVVICGDNDCNSKTNTGLVKATQAGQGLSLDVIVPNDIIGSDFNDYHQEKGLEKLSNFLNPKTKPIQENKKDIITTKSSEFVPYEGLISDVYNYYNVTSGNDQKGFAMQTAIAFGSIILARNFSTNMGNFPSVYLLNIGKSATGKEHPKTVLENLLYDCDMAELIAGDGYTSSGGVFSTLLLKPKHMSIIDEMGHYLQASKAGVKGGNTGLKESNTKLMEAFGRCHSTMRPQNYSSMTLSKEQAEKLKERTIYNPAITVLGMTTPSTFFEAVDMSAVKDGFINRFLISISDAERSIRVHKEPIETPESIKRWVRLVNDRSNASNDASVKAEPIRLDFTPDALDAQEEFQRYCIGLADKLEQFGMEELSGRSNEIALRIALICALSKDPHAKIVDGDDVRWAIEYVKMNLDKVVSRLKMSVSQSDYEADKKLILQAIRDMSKKGEWIKRGLMNKKAPFSRFKKRDLDDILRDLVDAELITEEVSSGVGKPTLQYMAI